MSDEKELAYRYDLFVTPDWKDRFDTLINENLKLPIEGRFLDVNCGTGSHALELAERMRDKGEVVGLDPSAERIAIARSKAQVKKAKNLNFEQGIVTSLQFESEQFDVVIGDASMSASRETPEILAEMVRVARPEGLVILKQATRGSFDEFFSIYWEALHDIGIDDEVWGALEELINEQRTVSDAERLATNSGLHDVKNFTSREEFSYESADDFLEAPLINDNFLSDWLGIVPESSRDQVRQRIASIVERERHNAPFEVSIKATLIVGVK